jgi:pyruvate/2-oxoglutarate/acetoin dehydrogenase E1 component
MPGGGGHQLGPTHSHSFEALYLQVPGLLVACPSTPGDAKGLLKSAIRDDNPVLFLEHKRLYSVKGETNGEPIPLGQAAVVREGADLTIATAMKSVHDALAAAETLSVEGIEATVIDLRTLRPLDVDTVVSSVEATNRLLVVEEGPVTGGWAGEVLAQVTERALGQLDVAWRLTTPDLPIPYSPPLEDAFLPGPDAIVESVRAHLS